MTNIGKNVPQAENGHAVVPVTMVIPAYNAARYLNQTLASIEEQTVLPVEVIVVDDGSRDETLALLQRRKAVSPLNLRVIEQSNQGPSVARNAGISAAATSFVALLDADDYLYPSFLEETWSLACADRVFDVVFTDRDVVNEVGERTGKLDLGHPEFRKIPIKRLDCGAKMFAESPFRYLLRGNLIPGASVLLRRSVWEAVGGYDSEFSHAEDRLFYLRVSKLSGDFAFIDKPLGAYRRHGASLTSANNHVSMALGGERLLEKLRTNAQEWELTEEEMHWVDMALRDARLNTEHAVRYGVDPKEWQAISMLVRRGRLTPLAAVWLFVVYLARKLWYKLNKV